MQNDGTHRLTKMKIVLYVSAALSLASALLACGSADNEWSSATIRDSAGVQIVENADIEPPSDRRWQLVEAPTLTVGGGSSDDPAGLFRVTGAHRLPDGRVAVANSGTSEIKFYAPDGRFLSSVGTDGNGPGEYRAISGMFVLAPDSLLLYDGRLERLSVVHMSGEHVRSFRFDQGIDPIVYPVGVLSNGGVMALKASHMVSLPRAGINIDSALILRFDRTGALIDSLGRSPHNSRYVKRVGNLQTTLGVPFAPSGHLAVKGGGFCYAWSDSFAVSCYDLTGRLNRVIRLASKRVPISDAMVDAYFESQLRSGSPNYRRALARLRAELPIPEHLPAFASIKADQEDNLWIQEYPDIREDERSALWRVFDSQGVLHAVVTMPATVAPIEIGEGYILALVRDDLDVEHVRLYCLAKTERRANREC